MQASELPLSIVIIGVGPDDFGTMERLDSDKARLKDSRGRAVARDIVQFVHFTTHGDDVEQLTREVLAEVPKQLTGYMKSRRVEPLAKVGIITR